MKRLERMRWIGILVLVAGMGMLLSSIGCYAKFLMAIFACSAYGQSILLPACLFFVIGAIMVAFVRFSERNISEGGN